MCIHVFHSSAYLTPMVALIDQDTSCHPIIWFNSFLYYIIILNDTSYQSKSSQDGLLIDPMFLS